MQVAFVGIDGDSDIVRGCWVDVWRDRSRRRHKLVDERESIEFGDGRACGVFYEVDFVPHHDAAVVLHLVVRKRGAIAKLGPPFLQREQRLGLVDIEHEQSGIRTSKECRREGGETFLASRVLSVHKGLLCRLDTSQGGDSPKSAASPTHQDVWDVAKSWK